MRYEGAMASPHVLVMGYRRGLTDVLRRRRLPFCVWHDRKLALRGAPLHVAPFETSVEKMREGARALAGAGPFSHVIAAVERAVVAASYARQELAARRSAHTTAMRCHDKLFMKETLAAQGIPMTPFRRASHARGGAGLVDELGAPLVVKDRRSSGGRGITITRDPREVDGVASPMRIAERFVRAREASVESFVHEERIVFTNITEYLEKRHVNVVPAKLDPATRAAILEINRRVIEALRIRWGMTHLEVYLTRPEPLFGEIALRPPGGYIMELLQLAWGFSAWEAFVDVELGAEPRFPGAPSAHAAAWVIHPGEGVVRSVEGAAEIETDPDVVRARIKASPGDEIGRREGAGDEIGNVWFKTRSRKSLLAALERAQATLRIAVSARSDGR
jgi:biotin carboxylase